MGALLHLGKGKRDENFDTDRSSFGLLLSFAPAHALTIDEIIKLKKAGVSDSTIELLIERDGSPRAAGTWRTKDGWIIHTTEVRERSSDMANYNYANASSIRVFVEPNVSVGRRSARLIAEVSSASLSGWPAPRRHGSDERDIRWNR